MQIEISFERWKQLTALLLSENDTYDEVLGRVLDRCQEAPAREMPISKRSSGGAYYKGVFLPNGTKLRATYKGRTHFGSIVDGEWTDNSTGEVRSSPSQAAFEITESGVNGWLFWSVKRPHDPDWQTLNALRS
jgi:hypothetical protein